MSDINNTVSASAVAAASQEVKGKKQSLSAITLRDALKAVRDNENSNWNLVTSIVAMTVDALARNVKDKIPHGKDPKPDARRAVPGMVTSTHSKVIRELKVNMVLAGRSPFSNSEAGVAAILVLPRETKQQRNIRRAQAEKLVDSPYMFEGRPCGPFKNNLIPAEFAGCEAKANNESMKLGNKYSAFIVDWFWNSNRDLIQSYATRVAADWKEGDATPFIDLNGDDLETIRNHIRETFGENMTQLEASYRSGRPVRAERSRLESMQNTFNKLGHAEMMEFLRWAQGRAAEVAREDSNVKKATEDSTDADDDIDDVLREFAAPALATTETDNAPAEQAAA